MQEWGYQWEEDFGKKYQRWVVTRDFAWRCEHDGCNIAVFKRTLLSILHSQSRNNHLFGHKNRMVQSDSLNVGPNFGGKSLVLKDQNVQDLQRKGFNDRVSSLIVIDGQWTLYRHGEYGGTRWHVQHTGGPERDGTYPQVHDWRGGHDQISSVRVGHHD
jgi:Beta/Gamma crystallin